MEQLPLMMTAKDLQAMGFSRQITYQLLNREDAPTVRIGKRIFVPKYKFLDWFSEFSGKIF